MRFRAPLLAIALLAACSGGPEAAYQRGVTAFEAGNIRTARVEFMNALQADPDNRPARIMQARVLLALGDGAAAQAEVERARQSGVAAAQTHHLLAHARLLQGDARGALAELADVPPAHAAYAARIRGRAAMTLGDNVAAAQAFDEALRLSPNDSALWTDIALFRRNGGEIGGAIQAADRAVAANPRNTDALLLRGELTRTQYGLAAALPWFSRVIEVDANHVNALLERAITYGDMGRMREMLADVRTVHRLTGGHPMAWYLQAMLAARARNYTLARSLLDRTRGMFAEMPAAMLLAGAIDFGSGNLPEAAERLGRLVQLQPGNRKARRLLAATQWRMGNAAAVVETLVPIANQPDADSYSLSLIGRALADQGDDAHAAFYLARAARPQPPVLAAIEPIDGRAFDELRAAASQRPGDVPLQVRYVSALLARGLGADALVRARQLQAANPGAPEVHMLVGDALGTRGDFRAAAEDYRRAANIAFSEPVALRLIEALQRSGQIEAAGTVLTLFLQQNPRNIPALILYAGRAMQAEDWPQAIRIYESLRRRIGSNDATILNNLAWAYSEEGDYDRAIPLARHAWSLDRDNPATADTYGWILFKSGADRTRGLVLLERAARGAPSDTDIRRRLEQARRS